MSEEQKISLKHTIQTCDTPPDMIKWQARSDAGQTPPFSQTLENTL